MNMTYLLPTLIGICLIFLLLAAHKNTLRGVVTFLASFVFGSGCLLLANHLGFGLGWNLATGLVVGLLGTPGFLGLAVLAILL